MCKDDVFGYLFKPDSDVGNIESNTKVLESELFFGITYLLGAEREAERVIDELKAELQNQLVYNVYVINVADIIQSYNNCSNKNYNYKELMEHAKIICDECSHSSALMWGAVDRIMNNRSSNHERGLRNAYIINAIKRPEELALLKKVYRESFFLIGLYMPESERRQKLENDILLINQDEMIELMKEDGKSSSSKYGTNSKNVYYQADVLIDVSSCSVKSSMNTSIDVLKRLINLIFGNPYCTPTFSEHAMFMAFNNSSHSSDLSRQVGAALCTDNQIISLGANECCQAGGIPYFTNPDYSDAPGGKDFKRGYDSNKHIINEVINDIVQRYNAEWNRSKDSSDTSTINIDTEILEIALRSSEIRSVTEYGRMIHAEMNAIINCARRGVSTLGGVLYCTTFPCHNCAKHIVAAGIQHVYFVEPYPKSKALELFDDSIVYHYKKVIDDKRVVLEPYIGITAKRYHDLFSIKNNYGYNLTRKDTEIGNIIDFSLNHNSHPRFIVPIFEYKAMETVLSNLWNDKINH